MEKIIKKISGVISFIVVFFMAAVFYFNFKGFTYVDGQLILIRQIAEAAPQNGIAAIGPANIRITASDRYAIGSPKAPWTLYEYSSLGCPHCADFHLDILPKLVERYVDTGYLRIIFVHFPLDKKSMKAALLAHCMNYDDYHAFVRHLFDYQRSWWLDEDDDRLLRYAAEFGLGYDEAQRCMHDDKVAQEIITDRQQALTKLHINGTPALVVSGADSNEIIHGEPKYDRLIEYLDQRLGITVSE
ncbi:MAG: DsbA family protein [Alphaproteobacteria bacterium]|nr:DsbA family protein [Alphaproteobacteria bacterium]